MMIYDKHIFSQWNPINTNNLYVKNKNKIWLIECELLKNIAHMTRFRSDQTEFLWKVHYLSTKSDCLRNYSLLFLNKTMKKCSIIFNAWHDNLRINYLTFSNDPLISKDLNEIKHAGHEVSDKKNQLFYIAKQND